MENPFLHRKSMQNKGITFLMLILILFVSLVQLSSYALIQQHLVSYYGVEAEDISMSFMAMYCGILTFLPIQFRLLRYFTMRSYLMTALSLGILINFGSFQTHDIVVFIVLRFFQGVVVATTVGSMLIVIFSTRPGEQGNIIGSAIFFASILTCSVIIGFLSSWIAQSMDWNLIYYGLVMLQVTALLFCFLIFHPRIQLRPFPLYQIDWIGSMFFANFSISLTYVMIYGPKKYWFSSFSICVVSIFCFVMLALLIYRQTTLKRPFIDLRVFKYGKFILGLMLLIFFYGIKDTINLIYGYSGSILGWSSFDIVQLGICNSAGVVLAIWFSAKKILKDKLNVPKLIIAGFSVMLLYNLWMYFFLTPNLSFIDLACPVFFQGIGSGFIFLPVMIFTISSVPKFTGFTAIIICSYARFIASLNSLAGFYTLQLNYNSLYKEGFLGHLTNDDPNFIQRNLNYQNLFLSKGYSIDQAAVLSNMMISKAVGVQGQLLTNKSIFLVSAMLICAAISILLLFVIHTKVKLVKQKVHLS